MASSQKTETNQRNSRKSTGPKTVAGKAIVSQNAMRHGLLSSETILRGENADIFEQFQQGLYQELKPIGGLEVLLVDRIVSSAWRLRRLMTVEVSMFMGQLESIQQEQDNQEQDACLLSVNPSSKTSHPLGLAFRYREDTVAKLSRYETTLERGLYKALHELQRLQSVRSGVSVTPPPAFDVDVSVSHEGEMNGFVS